MLCVLMPSVEPVPTSLQQRIAGRAVAVFLRALEAFRVDRQHGNSLSAAHARQTASTSSPITPTMQVE